MRTSRVILWGCIIIILCLIGFNIKIMSLQKQMSNGCQIDYSSYVKKGTCPCVAPQTGAVGVMPLTSHFSPNAIKALTNSS
jgi:hypothetical protein